MLNYFFRPKLLRNFLVSDWSQLAVRFTYHILVENFFNASLENRLNEEISLPRT